jgi:hypothetical protein
MAKSRPQPPRPDRRRAIRGSFSWIDHRFLREGFDQGLTRLEKLLYFVLVAVSNQDGVSFYSDARLAELLEIRFPHELEAARNELVAKDLIAYADGIYQVLDLPACSPKETRASFSNAAILNDPRSAMAGLATPSPGASASNKSGESSCRFRPKRSLNSGKASAPSVISHWSG